jgi:hypothetical protein
MVNVCKGDEMNNEKHIWVVEFLDDCNQLLSVHDTQENALAARDAYIKSYRHGGTTEDYWVHAVRINRTGLEGDME